MTIRFATAADTARVVRALRNKHLDYNTPAQAKEDISLGRLIVAEENGKAIASCAIVPEVNHNYTAIKRMIVYSKKNCGKGIATALINFVCSLGLGDIGATPWNTNPAACHSLEKCGFVYQYTFLTFYNFYKKST